MPRAVGQLRDMFSGATFGTKVLVPVVSIMVLSLVLTTWLANRRIIEQFQAEAARGLETADAVFRSSESLHAQNLLLRFGNLPNDPRYKSALQSKYVQTLREALKDLPGQQGVDVVLFTSGRADLQASAQRDPNLQISEFGISSTAAVRQALKGEPKADTIRVGDKLFDVVAVPVFGSGGIFGGGGAAPIGVLTIGSEIGDAVAREFSQLTHSQIVLLANGHVVASTVPRFGAQADFAQLFNAAVQENPARRGAQEVVLGNEHYSCGAGKFSSLNGDAGLGYLLLCSYERPLQAFHRAQQMVLLLSGLAIVLGTGVIGFLVRKITEPLRQLRANAEAVGRGDFSREVAITSRDECGELAGAFNAMTGNLKRSREELERTVTALKSTQMQLVESEKLSGLGEFVAGVAHELNNPLTSVMGFSEILTQTPGHPKQEKYLDMIYRSSQRCQKIVQSLLAFARRHPPERKLCSVNTLVESAVEFMQYQLRTGNIEIVTQLDATVPAAMLDSHQMQQVFLNILNNARQAIEARGRPGRVVISTENLGTRMRMSFEDNGGGIAEENVAKLFNPFFTTKEVGQGTGLGLSFCYGVVREHGGEIKVRSKEGEGATFVIELPLIATVVEAPLRAAETVFIRRALTAGEGKRVLVIDDEESILEMVRSELQKNAYEVDITNDSEVALRRIGEKRYDLVLCDWRMPGLSGRDLYERVQASNPELCQRWLFMTGDVISERIQAFLKERGKRCLLKPFSLAEFRAAMEETLRGVESVEAVKGEKGVEELVCVGEG